MKYLSINIQNRLAKGSASAKRYNRNPRLTKSQKWAVIKKSAISPKATTNRNPKMCGEYNTDRNNTCIVVKYLIERTFASVSSHCLVLV